MKAQNSTNYTHKQLAFHCDGYYSELIGSNLIGSAAFAVTRSGHDTATILTSYLEVLLMSQKYTRGRCQHTLTRVVKPAPGGFR